MIAKERISRFSIDDPNAIVIIDKGDKFKEIVQDTFEKTVKLNYKCKKGTKDPDTNECDVSGTSNQNWSERTSDKVVNNPFEEGAPSKEKVKIIKEFVDKNKDKYNPTYIKFYHGTDSSLGIENEGLLPTSESRRRSFQSTSGYVYLANTPERAKVFGDLGNQGKSTVYEVIVPGYAMLPDKDQLNNQRDAGVDVGNSVAESIVYGGGIRIKGKIEPWQIQKYVTSKSTLPDKSISIDGAVKAIKSMNIDLNDKRVWHSTRDIILEKLAKQNGFDGRAQMVTKEYFKEKSKDGTVLYRGLLGHMTIEQVMEGEYYAGSGISGNGIYASDIKSFAKRYSERNGTLITMLLPNNSKVVDIQELFSVRRKFLEDNKNHDDFELLNKIVKDAGRFAVMMGYDAVKIPTTSEMIILNRSKILVQG